MAEPLPPAENAASAPAESAAPAAPPQPEPNGSEPETNPGNEPAMVPSDRLREETEKRRRAEEERDALKAAQEPKPTPPSQEDDLDPDVEKLLDGYVKKRGFVSQEDLAAERQRVQVQQDVKDLESTPPVAGIAYDHKDVIEYAEKNNLPITSKAALQAAYKEMNWEKIVESEHQRAIDGYKNAGKSAAETPGSPGAAPPAEPEITAKDPRQRTRERLKLARQKLSV